MDEREMTPIAGGVQRRRGFGEMVANNAGVADLFVTKRELVVGETNGARVVGELRVFQRPHVQRNRARLFAAGKGQTAVQAPEGCQAGVGEWFADGVRRASQRRRGLRQVVLQQPGGGQPRPNGRLVVFVEGAGAQQRREQLRGFGAAPTVEGDVRAAEGRLRGTSGHPGGYLVYRSVTRMEGVGPLNSFGTLLKDDLRDLVQEGRIPPG